MLEDDDDLALARWEEQGAAAVEAEEAAGPRPRDVDCRAVFHDSDSEDDKEDMENSYITDPHQVRHCCHHRCASHRKWSAAFRALMHSCVVCRGRGPSTAV